MLTLFKGQLSLDEILHELPKKRLMELRNARIRALKEEREMMEKDMKEQERLNARNQILAR